MLLAAMILEIVGVLKLITNDEILIPKIGLGFKLPDILAVEIQGVCLLIAGGASTVYALMSMEK